MSDLRTYQIPAHKAAIDFFAAATPKPGIIVAPTAFGKSHLIAHTANDIKGNTLVLQPTKELLEQNYAKFISLGGHATVYSASLNTKQFSNIVYATIGSIKGLGDRFAARDFTNMIIDEAHMYPRESLPEPGEKAESMIAKFVSASGIKKILGLTATPFKLQSNTDLDGNRFSKLQMLTSRSKYGQLFRDIIHATQIQEIVKLGYWSKLEYEQHPFDDRDLEWNSTRSDYTEESMLFNFERQGTEQKILDRLRQLNDRKSVLVFVPSIAIAERMAAKLPGAYAVHSKTPDDKRDWIIKSFKRCEIKYVFNVNVLAVGFDHDQLDCIVSGRKTGSLAWFYQAIGRGTRINPLKKDCLIIDFVDNVKRFGKIEDIYFKKKKTWQVYGEGGRLLTGLAMDQIGSVFDGPISGIKLEFGKYKGKDISEVPREYIEYMLREFTWTDRNYYIKEACQLIIGQKQTA